MPAGSDLTVRMQAAAAAAVAGAVMGGWLLVVATGGTPNAWAHVLYGPILVAALLWGLRGAVLVAATSGVLLGPLSPHASTMTDAAFHASWLSRLGFFLAIGTLASVGSAWAQRRDRQLRAVIANAADLVLLTDPVGTVQFASPSARSLLGYEPERLAGQQARDLVHPDDDLPGADEGARVIRVRHADGSWRHLETIASPIHEPEGTTAAVVVNARDVTEREALQAQVSHLTYHDPATSLPNRNLLLARIQEGLASDAPRSVTVITVGVEHLDDLAASLAEGADARILVGLADRLESMVRETDCIARVGDSTLAVCCHHLRDATEAQALLGRISGGFSEPILIADEPLHVKVTMGVCFADGEADAAELLQRALTARRAASETSRPVAFYRGGQTDGRSGILAGLHRALERGEFELHYQPVVRIPTSDVIGVEALIRWHHPTAGLVSPAEFIPVAERSGLIESIGRWVLEEACRQVAHWRSTEPGLASLGVAVNVSAHQLLRTQLHSDVVEAIHLSGLDPAALTLEITESVMMEHLDAVAEELRALKGLGVSLAVDDFGTGYSSLGYLRGLPVDLLKIDRIFINDLNRPDGASIISAIIGLAHTFGMAAVAEGVEDRDQMDQLVDLGCDFAQGFYLARPRPADELVELLGATDHLPRTRSTGQVDQRGPHLPAR